MKPKDLIPTAAPDVFSEAFLGMTLSAKQKLVMRALMPRGARVVFRSCNEGGKTSRVIVGLILWHLMAFKRGQVKLTSGSWAQIETQLVPKLQSLSHKFPSWRFLTDGITTPDPMGFLTLISTNDAGRFEGAHQDTGDDSPLLIIVDEAKSVPNEIFDAIERCRPTRLLLASSPGLPEGEFYRACTDRAGFYDKSVVQTATDCPWLPADHIERMEAKYGKDHPLVRSMLWAEFMVQSEDMVVNMAALERVLQSPPDVVHGPKSERKGFVDFAAGRDENVFAVRDGNEVRIVKAWREQDTMRAASQLVQLFVESQLTPQQISGDADGLGKPIIDRLAQLGWPIGYFHGGKPPQFDEHYANAWAERWFSLARDIERGVIVLPAGDMDLRAQLLSRKQEFNDKGKLRLESKDKMRSRGVQSPDRADAVAGCMGPLLRRTTMSMLVEQREHFGDGDNHATATAGFEIGD